MEARRQQAIEAEAESMTNRTVKFNMTIKEISFEFEGSEEIAEGLHETISQTLSAVSDVQSKLLNGNSNGSKDRTIASAEQPSLPTQPSRKRRRRKTKKNSSEQNNETVDVEATPLETAEDSPKTKRPRSESCSSQVRALLEAEFFLEKRTVKDIRDELSRRGYHFSSNNISSVLLQLTKKDDLVRDKNEDGNWRYWFAK